MNVQELIEPYESYEVFGTLQERSRKCTFLRDLKQLDDQHSGHVEEAPRYVRTY